MLFGRLLEQGYRFDEFVTVLVDGYLFSNLLEVLLVNFGAKVRYLNLGRMFINSLIEKLLELEDFVLILLLR